MGKNIRFRPCLVKQAYDGAGRHMSITDAGDDELKQLQFKEELQVQVDDKDRKTMTMWSAEDFEDKLDMMRTAFAQFQDQQLGATGKQLLVQVDKEVFGDTRTSDFAADLRASFSLEPNQVEDLEAMFQAPGEHARASVAKIRAQRDSEIRPVEVEEAKDSEPYAGFAGDMAAFDSIHRQSAVRPKAGAQDAGDEDGFARQQAMFQDEDDFNQRASMMSMGGGPIQRRTAIGRSTVTSSSGPPAREGRKTMGAPRAGPSDSLDPAVVRQAFLECVMGKHTPYAVLKDLYSRPLPEAVGALQCTVIRDQSGVNKFSPKYSLQLAESGTRMLQAAKVQSISTHMLIKVDSPFINFIAKGQENLVGRLRGGSSSRAFYVYDFGVNPKDVRPGATLALGQRARRQLGTILYSKARADEPVDKHLEVYTPEIADAKEGVKSWIDDAHKKERIAAEYQEYLDQRSQGAIHVNMSPQRASELDAEVAKQETSGIAGYKMGEVAALGGGSLKKASRKNFSLVSMTDSDSVYFSFGRVLDHHFTMEVQHPFSLLQAFAMCLSTFEYKV